MKKKSVKTITINSQQLIDMIGNYAIAIIKNKPNATYCADKCIDIQAVASHIAKSKILKPAHLEAVRTDFEAQISKKFKVNFHGGMDAFTHDLEQELINKKVPQTIQVMSGLLDTTIGMMRFPQFV